MKPWLYTALLIPGPVLVSLAFPGNRGFINLPMIPFILAIAWFAFNAWTNIKSRQNKANPFWYVLPLFIPFVGIFWSYVVLYPLGRAIKAEAKRVGLALDVGDTFSRAVCHLQVASIVFIIGSFVLWGIQPAHTASSAFETLLIITAFSPLVLWLVLMHIVFFHYSKIINEIAYITKTESIKT